MQKRGNNFIVWIGISANVLIAIAKFVAAAFTGSAGMLAEGIHSLVDAADGSLLLVGEHLGRRQPDDTHPFGYGREIFFWSFLVALILFGVGGGISIYRGIVHLMHPRELSDVTWNYAVLGTAFVFDGVSWIVTFRHFNRRRPANVSLWRHLRGSKDPTVYTVLLEDTSDLLGLLIAFAGILIGQLTGSHHADAVASILIGLVLATIAFFLMVETRSLLLGEAADKASIQKIQTILRQDSAVVSAEPPATVHVAPHRIVVVLHAQFREGLSLDDYSAASSRIEQAVRRACPDVERLYIDARPAAAHLSLRE